jgi:hypothetical protein
MSGVELQAAEDAAEGIPPADVKVRLWTWNVVVISIGALPLRSHTGSLSLCADARAKPSRSSRRSGARGREHDRYNSSAASSGLRRQAWWPPLIYFS